MRYIGEKYPALVPLYSDIFQKKKKTYWVALAQELEALFHREKLHMVNYFYHEEIRKP